MASKVFFTDMKTRPGMNLTDKLEKLVIAAGIETIDFNNKFAALKIHFGEPGNLAYLRPNYAARLAKLIKSLGGKPFLTDCSTLYSGKRSNAPAHLDAAAENGFTPMTLGCNVIIADGLKGTEYREIPINGARCSTAKIGSAIADADILISLNHFKGHEMAGFGGAIKNLGMGCGSRGGKLEMHSTSKPAIAAEKCTSCAMCIKYCAQKAIKFDSSKKAQIDYDLCIGCSQCIAMCQYGACGVVWSGSAKDVNEKIAEYAFAAVKDKPSFHINFIVDVSPDCDCWAHNDIPLVPDIGIAASFDPIALDRACVDLVNGAPVMAGSALDIDEDALGDKFTCIHKNTDWRIALSHGEQMGLGTQEYEIVKVE